MRLRPSPQSRRLQGTGSCFFGPEGADNRVLLFRVERGVAQVVLEAWLLSVSSKLGRTAVELLARS